MKRITANTIDTIANKLRRMPPTKKQPVYSSKEAVELLESEIAALQKRGYSLAQVSKALRDEGLEIDTATLRSYLPSTPAKSPRALPPKTSKKAAVPVKKPVKKTKKLAPAAASPKSGTRRAMFELKPDTDDI